MGLIEAKSAVIFYYISDIKKPPLFLYISYTEVSPTIQLEIVLVDIKNKKVKAARELTH